MPVPKALLYLGYFAAVSYFIGGIVGGFWPSHWDEAGTANQALWIILMVGGAVLVLVGLRVFPRSPWGGAALVSVGGFFGAVPIFWTGVALVVGVLLVVLSVRHARGPSRAARRAEPVD